MHRQVLIFGSLKLIHIHVFAFESLQSFFMGGDMPTCCWVTKVRRHPWSASPTSIYFWSLHTLALMTKKRHYSCKIFKLFKKGILMGDFCQSECTREEICLSAEEKNALTAYQVYQSYFLLNWVLSIASASPIPENYICIVNRIDNLSSLNHEKRRDPGQHSLTSISDILLSFNQRVCSFVRCSIFSILGMLFE